MYETTCIIINVLCILILLTLYIVLIYKDKRSMFNYAVISKIYITYIVPFIIVIINIVIDFIFKVKIEYWLLSCTPLIIPTINYLIEKKNMYDTKKAYRLYSDELKNILKSKLDELGVSIHDKNIKMFFTIRDNNVHCKAILKLNATDSMMTKIKHITEIEIKRNYKHINFELFIDRINE